MVLTVGTYQVLIDAIQLGAAQKFNPLYSVVSFTGVSELSSLLHNQHQVLASMVGFDMPDKTRRAIERIHGRIQALSARAKELAGLLNHALHVQDLDVTPEAQASECIALNLSEVLKDLEDLRTPDLAPNPDAKANPGGQMALPV